MKGLPGAQAQRLDLVRKRNFHVCCVSCRESVACVGTSINTMNMISNMR